MKNIEGLTEKQDIHIDKLSGRERLEVILGLFGTKEAREKFLELCRNYHQERHRPVLSMNDGENYRRSKNIKSSSSPQRAFFHNAIMETIQRLSLGAKNPSELQRDVLREMVSREEVARCIKDYIAFDRGAEEDDDEDEEQKNPRSSSSAVYYHSLGKGT